MDRKSHLLSHLKKQVICLRNQLERISKAQPSSRLSPHVNSRHQQSSHSHSPRFDSSSFDSTYLQRGIRKYPPADSKFKNIAQIIHQKSKMQRNPRISARRKMENERTKENFSTQRFQSIKSKPKSPNPISGQGYSSKKQGRKLVAHQKAPQQERSSERKHFINYIYDHF